MAVIINATTTTGLTTSADNSGVIQFQSNGANTVGISSTGYLTIGGNQQIYGPAFSAHLSANQSISASTFTKVTANTEEFDTASCYNNTTNYRFTPNVAGYYQINGMIETVGAVGSVATIYKNGAEFKRGVNLTVGAYTYGSAVSALIYFNGSTDYVELYVVTGANATLVGGFASTCYFQGSMVRGA